MKFNEFLMITQYKAICMINFDFSTDDNYNKKRNELLTTIKEENNKLLKTERDESAYCYQKSYYILITQKSRSDIERLIKINDNIDLTYIKLCNLYKVNIDLYEFTINLLRSIQER